MKNHIGNFTIQRSRKIEEINIHLVELVHEKTNATVLHLACDDDENVFNISLRTFPDSSNGAAHVLEHIVLCGSERFPVKDPFFAMGRRSMNTFMNALTGADFTCYPAASLIEHDFYNLFEVYLDAVFHPRLLEESFWQEGIHLEFEKSLKAKGIVYNEMKGALSNPETRLHEEFFELLFPNLPYRFNSGGNPKQIRMLAYQDVKEFHKKYYHPSRALFYFYGNLSLEKHLNILEERVLTGIEKFPPLPLLPKQQRFAKKISKLSFYPFAQEEKKEKTLIALGFLTASLLEQEEVLALSVIELALMGTDAAPLKSALLKSKLCKQVDSSLDEELSEVPFILTFKGCDSESAEALNTLVYETLNKLKNEGIPKHLIEGALHQLEFSRTEIGANSFPYGLSLFFRSGLAKQHGGDPIEGLQIHTLFKKLRERFNDPYYIPTLLSKYFLNNSHSVMLTMQPNFNLAKEEQKEEEEFIKTIEEKLDEQGKELLSIKAGRLRTYQEEEGDLEILPRLTLNDVPKEGKDFPLHVEQEENFSFFHHDCFTNDILYSALYFPLPFIEEKELAFFRIFTLLVPELGSGGRDYKAHLDYVFQHTGGIELDCDLFVSAENPLLMCPALSIQGKALERHMGKMCSLFADMVKSVDFTDTHRLDELLKQHLEGLENSIQKNPLRYAVNLATSGLSDPLQLHYRWYGLDYYWNIKEMVAQFLINPLPFQKKMEDLKEKVFALNEYHLVVSATKTMYEDLKNEHFFGLSKMQKGAKHPPSTTSLWHNKIQRVKPISQGRLIASPVAFTALALPGVAYVHPLNPALSVAAELMENKTLHKRIREQGGAYGGGASHMGSWGYFYFYSYRDPHLKSTLDAFYEAVNELRLGNFNERDLEEAKLGVLQGLDTPTPPENRATTAYTWLQTEKSKKMRQTYRTRLLSLKKEDIQRATEEILLPGIETKATLVTFAGKELLAAENLLLKDKALPVFSIQKDAPPC